MFFRCDIPVLFRSRTGNTRSSRRRQPPDAGNSHGRQLSRRRNMLLHRQIRQNRMDRKIPPRKTRKTGKSRTLPAKRARRNNSLLYLPSGRRHNNNSARIHESQRMDMQYLYAARKIPAILSDLHGSRFIRVKTVKKPRQ